MGTCCPKLTRYQLTPEKVTELLENNGGTLTLSTTPYAAELSLMEKQYWQYHSPWGNPGDILFILENYRVEKLCQNADGYIITIKYEDGKEVATPSKTPMAITAKDKFISAGGAVPDLAIRLRLVIQDVQLVGDDWVFTVARVIDSSMQEPEQELSCSDIRFVVNRSGE